MLKKILLLGCAVSFLGFCGCISLNKTHTGFLKSYKGFTESTRFPGSLVYNRRLGEMNNYSKYIIEPVVVYYADPNKSANVPQDVADGVASYFTSELIKDLQDKYPIVDTRGPGVLRIRIALTDIASSIPLMNIHPGMKMTGAGAGGACMEGEAVDSMTGRRIAAFIDCRKGSEWNITGGLDDWEYAKDVCASWARDFRSRMDIGYKDIATGTDANSDDAPGDTTTSAAEPSVGAATDNTAAPVVNTSDVSGN